MIKEVIMNQYIITREEIRGQEYIISALYGENKKMLEVLPDAAGQRSILNNIYIGKVENIVQNLNAAFVKISPNERCYLPLEDLKHPVFTQKVSLKKKLVAGDELLVQVSKEALKTKEPAVTTNLSFPGTYAVLTTGNRKLSVSSKLSKEMRSHYLELLKEWIEGETDFGVIIRTNAANASDEAVLDELDELKARCMQLLASAQHKTAYSLLYEEPAPHIRHLNDLHYAALEKIVTDDRSIFEQVCEHYRISKEALMTQGSVSVPVNTFETEDGIKICYYEDDMVSLSSLYSVKSNLEDALKTRVWLKSGAYLLIEHTEALTVIDVNTGKNIAKRAVMEHFLNVDLEAALEIARQLRLRNISGMILVDFINLTDDGANAELLAAFRKALKTDPVPTQLIDMTKLGLVEVTRKKVKRSLREILT